VPQGLSLRPLRAGHLEYLPVCGFRFPGLRPPAVRQRGQKVESGEDTAGKGGLPTFSSLLSPALPGFGGPGYSGKKGIRTMNQRPSFLWRKKRWAAKLLPGRERTRLGLSQARSPSTWR